MYDCEFEEEHETWEAVVVGIAVLLALFVISWSVASAEPAQVTISKAKWERVNKLAIRAKAKITKLKADLKAALVKLKADRNAYAKKIAGLRVLVAKVRKPPKCPRPVGEWAAIGALGLLVVAGGVVIVWQATR